MIPTFVTYKGRPNGRPFFRTGRDEPEYADCGQPKWLVLPFRCRAILDAAE